MKLQVLQDNLGNQTGVYVPMEDWNLIKNNYPDIETLEQDLPQWEKDLIDTRLASIAKNTESLKPIDNLLEELKRKI
ncbi:addiction module component CHP02574 family protein [Flavobacterium sp.]|uniref:addiction module component CHP02574 family protein n=1 Tax=Flavobacterium sp. TaxID=239 RepID=UPI0037531B75